MTATAPPSTRELPVGSTISADSHVTDLDDRQRDRIQRRSCAELYGIAFESGPRG